MHDDRTARAVIRDVALELFAAHGPDAVTVRQIAAAAGVSPGLVIHHFGSKEQLRGAVDDHVGAIFDELFAQAATGEVDMTDSASLTEAFLKALPADSPVPRYLRRLLLAGDATGTRLFQQWFRASQSVFEALVASGALTPGRDPVVRAAFLMLNDLLLLMLRDQLAAVLDVDPLSPDGVRRWSEEVLSIYQHGLFAQRPDAG